MYNIKIDDKVYSAEEGKTILEIMQLSGLHPDAPCGGKGSCKKCTVYVDGAACLACQTVIDRDMEVVLPKKNSQKILETGVLSDCTPDGEVPYALAFDIGTTTVVAFLLDGKTGATLAASSMQNPQVSFGADVISRIQYVLEHGKKEMQSCILGALDKLTKEVCKKVNIPPTEILSASIVGNTAMHHLCLGIDPTPLVHPPYMPAVFEALELPAEGLLPISKNGKVKILPNIAGFVGADTVGCIVATGYDKLEPTCLMIDIGTNGEMVLGNKTRRLACSTAAGPAFEGAKIYYGMRGADGAIDHVAFQDGELVCSVIGGGKAIGLCGSGLLDAISCLLQLGVILPSGKMDEGAIPAGRLCQADGCIAIRLKDEVVLTQKDIREVQLAKAAIRAGIELMMKQLKLTTADVSKVFLAGAFGNYLDPASACAIGLLPPELESRIVPVGNAAGSGAKMAVLSHKSWETAKELAAKTEFLELASLPEFQDCYVDCMMFDEEDDE